MTMNIEIGNNKKEDKRTDKRKCGDKGEEIACRYLVKKGYRIIDRNYLCKVGELDIIAFEPVSKTVAIIEVKTRNNITHGLPCEFVTRKKQISIIKATQCYLMRNPGLSHLPIRMDIFEVLFKGKEVYVRHLPNAF